jgi:serine protease Do
MKALMGKLLLAAVVSGLVVAALGAAGVMKPTVVWAQDRGVQRLEPRRVQIDGIGGSIGVNVRDVSAEEGQRAKLSPPQGAYVTQVDNGSPAQKAGIMTGDIIVEFDGERVRSARQLARLVRESPDDRTVKSTIVRDGNRRTVDLTPSNDRASFALPDLSGLDRQMRDLAQKFEFRYDGPGGRGFGAWNTGSRGRLGVALSSVSDQLADYFGVKRGVLVTSVDMDSPAGRAGLKAGDVITSVNGRSVDDPSDVLEEVRRADDGGALAITVTRDRKELKLSAKMPERERPTVRTGRSI